ncbi:hypothetical protein [Flavobacterium sp. H122]|uniref:hypothetical protein n=1 Tax=Flavobacterium sp. H122 TaxID=2529860 RepID=UPI0010AA461D|nr:hypothetical protein [Flavobacterium sp. H122]
MKTKLLDKILKVEKFLESLNETSLYQTRFETYGISSNHNYYKNEIKSFYNRPNCSSSPFEIIGQFKGIPFSRFTMNRSYKDSVIKVYEQEFYEALLYAEEDNTISIHKGINEIIFYFLLDKLRCEVEKFLDLIQGNDFRIEFSKYNFNIENNIIEFDKSKNDDVIKFLTSRGISTQLIEFFREKNNLIVMEKMNSGKKSYIQLFTIKSCMNTLKTFNFQNFELK